MAEKKEELYVGIKDQSDLRRSILESSKLSINLLQRYESFRELRKKREDQEQQLQAVNKELMELVSKLKELLPKYKFSKPKKSTEPKLQEKPVMAKQIKKPELEKLEQSLNDIQSRLNKL